MISVKNYLIDPIPKFSKNQGMFTGTDLVSPEMEFSKNEITPEHRIAYFLKKFKEDNNRRYEQEAKKIIRSIKNWKRLYRYLKAYDISNEFKKLYFESRKEIKKIPAIPKRYKRLMGMI